MDNRPLGIFDSGLGGLTVLKEILSIMPEESIVYFGDNGRAPYGTKSEETIVKYTAQDAGFLLEQDVKMLVIACNSASAYGYYPLKDNIPVPVIEVVSPGAKAAVKATKNGKIGVIGTSATIGSKVYEKALKSLDKDLRIYTKACPLFVSLAEEGWWDNKITRLVISEYLGELVRTGIDTLVLGCTHYPLLEKAIYEETCTLAGREIALVNSAREVAAIVQNRLKEAQIERETVQTPERSFYTSDSVEKFEELGSVFLGTKVGSAVKIDIEKY